MLDNWVRELREDKRYWKELKCFLFVIFFPALSDLHHMAAFSCGFVFERCSEEHGVACCLRFEKNVLYCATYKWITEKKQLLGSSILALYCTGSRSCFSGSSCRHLSAQGGTCSGFLCLTALLLPATERTGGFCPQLGKAFAIFGKGGKVTHHG